MPRPPALARKITLPLLLFYGLGNILGAGIYVLVGEVSNIAGMYAPYSFLVALFIVSFTALSYSELAARFPDSAGVALYVRKGLRSIPFSVIVGLSVALAGLVSAATISRGFTGYLAELIHVGEFTALFGLIALLGLVAAWGISESVTIAVLMTLVEIGGLGLILWIGAPAVATLPERLSEMLPPFEWDVWHTVFLGGFLAFYAFLGFEDMVNIAEEVKEPSTTFPKAMLAALTIATLLYLSVSLVSVLLLTPAELAATEAPFATMYSQATGEKATIITYISMVAIINGALIQIIMASRMLYGISKRGWLPTPLAYVNTKTQTPVVATLVVTLVTLAFALWLPLVTLANLTSSIVLVVFTIVNISLVRVKLRDPSPAGIRTVPIWIPATGAFFNVLFLGMQLFS
jgi:APA family basic amino acid/polyamine antiporter